MNLNPSNKLSLLNLAILITAVALPYVSAAHDFHSADNKINTVESTARYLGNEGILIESGEYKILFDPFFHQNFGQYALVPETIRTALFDNKPPYDDVDLLMISHAHDDHFDAKDVLRYLQLRPQVQLIAPNQAVDQLATMSGFKNIKSRVHGVLLAKDEAPKNISLKGLVIEAIRIPHAGWPGRADIENLVFRVTNKEQLTVMHLGDADPNLEHFEPFEGFFSQQRTHVAFPPYWFALSVSGRLLLDETLNADRTIGVHVPVNVPQSLKNSGYNYFSLPGQVVTIKSQSNE